MLNQSRAASLSRGELRHLLLVTSTTSQNPERDVLILLLGHVCGMRVSESAQVTVADMMHPSCKWRHEVSLRAAITKGCRQRCVYLTNKKLLAALDAYAAYRQRKDLSTTVDSDRYRGLQPHLPLILSRRGGAYSMNTKCVFHSKWTAIPI